MKFSRHQQQHHQMEVECPRHPGASTIGSLLLDETAPMAGKSWHPAMSPHAEGKKGTSYTDTIHTEQTREGRGGTNPETCSNAGQRCSKHERCMCMWMTEDCCLHRVTNASSKHKRRQQNQRERRPTTDALVQVPHITSLSLQEP